MKTKFFFFALSVMIVSCSDFLEPKSETLFIPKDAISLNEMLLGSAYSRPNQYNSPLNAGLQFLDDDITCCPYAGTVSSYDEPKLNGYRAVFNWQADMFERLSDGGAYKDIWESHYRLILGANAALDYIGQVEGTFNEKALVKGQAYALRAFYFFHLVNIFGEPYSFNKQAPGIPLKLNSGTEQKEMPRNTVEEVYQQVLSDLDEAEKNYMSLPQELQYRPDLRVNLPMVQLLKSRVFLYMERWKEAAQYAQKVISDWDFHLLDLNTIPPASSTLRTYYPIIDRNSPETIWLYGGTNDVSPYFSNTLTLLNDWRSRKIFRASAELLDGFVPGDLRKENYFYRESSTYDTVYMPAGKLPTSSPTLPITDSKAFAFSFRLSEAYLNLAESAAMAGDETTARKALNDLRLKRFDPATDSKINDSGSALIEKIRLERRLELCFEFHRWFDLRRYGMPELTHYWNIGQGIEKFTLRKNDAGYTLPIPEKVIQENRALQQNKLADRK